MNKLNFTSKKDIDEYLTNDFNVRIYVELTENNEWKGIFEPLDFLNLLYEKVEILNANKNKPLSFLNDLKNLDLEYKKFFYLLYNLKSYISWVNSSNQDNQLKICKDLIEIEYNKLKAKLYPIKYEDQQQIFKKTAQSLIILDKLNRKAQNWAFESNQIYNSKNNKIAAKENDAKQRSPKKFDELFYDTDLVKPCVDLLKELDPPFIDADYNFIGKLKGIVCVWIDELQRQSIVKHYSDRKIFASLISQKIKRFSIDESMFGKYHSKAEDKYRAEIKTMVSEIKRSHDSQ